MQQFAGPFKALFLCGYVLNGVQCIARLSGPKLTNYMIDNALLKQNAGALYKSVLLFCLLFAISEISRMLQTSLFVHVQESMTVWLRKNMEKAITRCGIYELRKIETGDLIHRMAVEIPRISAFYTKELPAFFTNAFILFFGIVMMWKLNARCTIAAGIILSALYFAVRYFLPQIQHITQQRTEQSAHFTAIVEEILEHGIILKLNQAYQYGDARFEKAAENLQLETEKLAKHQLIMSAVLTLITLFPNLFLYLWGGKLVLARQMTVGTLIALNAYVGYLISSVVYFAQSFVRFQQSEVGMKRYEEILSLCGNNEAIDERRDAIKAVKNFRTLSFQHVSFRYKERLALEDVSFEIEAGQRVWITGENGAGKTTLAYLMAGLLKPDGGKILFNGKDMQEVGFYSFNPMICMVTQENHLFEDTAVKNILLGRNELKDKLPCLFSEWDALGFFDGSFPKRKINSKGTDISGGQAKKINILRALLKDAPLVIFDEAEAFLDAKAKEALWRYIGTHPEKTFVLISHEKPANIKFEQHIFLKPE